MSELSKKLYFALFLLIFSAVLGLGLNSIITNYAKENPRVVCNTNDKFSDGCLISYAVELKLNKKQFIGCYQSQKYAGQITVDKKLGDDLGFIAAPGFFVALQTDNTAYKGFYLGAVTENEITSVIGDVSNLGLEQARYNWYVAQDAIWEKKIAEYLAPKAYSSSDYATQYNTLRGQINEYLKIYDIVRFETGAEISIGSGQIKVFFFNDFGASETLNFIDTIVRNVNANFTTRGLSELIIKDYPNANKVADSMSLALAARCANEQDAYYDYFDKLLTLSEPK